MILGIITASFRLAAYLIGDAILSKWMAAFKFAIEQVKDPAIKALVAKEYQLMNADIENNLDKRPEP